MNLISESHHSSVLNKKYILLILYISVSDMETSWKLLCEKRYFAAIMINGNIKYWQKYLPDYFHKIEVLEK